MRGRFGGAALLLQTRGIFEESDFLLAYLWTVCIVEGAEARGRSEANKQNDIMSTTEKETIINGYQVPTLWQFTLRLIRSGVMSRESAIIAMKQILCSRSGYVRTRYPLA